MVIKQAKKKKKKRKKKQHRNEQGTIAVELQYKPFNECTQPPQEQPGVMSLRTQSTDIFTQLCSLPSMTMSQDVSNVLQCGGGLEGQRVCVHVCVCVRGLKLRLRGLVAAWATLTYVRAQQTSHVVACPGSACTQPCPPVTPRHATLYHQKSWLKMIR